MKKIILGICAVAILGISLPTQSVNAYSTTYQVTSSYEEVIAALIELIRDLEAQLAKQESNSKTTIIYSGSRSSHSNRNTVVVGEPRSNRSLSDDEPDVDTNRARDIDDDSAYLYGDVDMNDFNNGYVFFVYGEDEDQVEDIASDYDEYSDVDEDGDDLQKFSIDSDLDGDASYDAYIYGLDDDTDYYFQICVEYEDDDDDEVIECGGVEDFTTED